MLKNFRGVGLAGMVNEQYQSASQMASQITGTAKCEVRKAEIPENIERLYLGTEGLSGAIAQLEGRLRPVLRPAEPTKEHSATVNFVTEMGDSLIQLDARVFLMIEAVHSILDRLEL
jgi:hypothetical protein